MRCKQCSAEIIRIHTMGGPVICWASPITYWPVRNSEAQGLVTQNGSNVYGNLTGELQDAVGVGYLPHACHQMLLILQGRDSWDRPVYKGSDENLCPTSYRRSVRVNPNGTIKKRPIRVGFRVLARSKLEADPNGTFL